MKPFVKRAMRFCTRDPVVRSYRLLQVAKDLVTHGFPVLVGSRNLERGEAAAKADR